MKTGKYKLSFLSFITVLVLSPSLYGVTNNSNVSLQYNYGPSVKSVLPVSYGAGTCHMLTDPLDITIHPSLSPDTNKRQDELLIIQVSFNQGYFFNQLGKNNIDNDRINNEIPVPSQNFVVYKNPGLTPDSQPYMPYIKAFANTGGDVYRPGIVELSKKISLTSSGYLNGRPIAGLYTATFNLSGLNSDFTLVLPSRDINYLQIRYKATVNTGLAAGDSGGSFTGNYALRWIRKNQKDHFLTLNDQDDWDSDDVNLVKAEPGYLPISRVMQGIDPHDFTPLNVDNVGGFSTPRVSIGLYPSVDGMNQVKYPGIDQIDVFRDYFRYSAKNIMSFENQYMPTPIGSDFRLERARLDDPIGNTFNPLNDVGIPPTLPVAYAMAWPWNVLRGTLYPSFNDDFYNKKEAWFNTDEYKYYTEKFSLSDIVSRMDYPGSPGYGGLNLLNTEALDVYVGSPGILEGTGVLQAKWRSFGVYGEPIVFRPWEYKNEQGNSIIISPKKLRDACY
ncbi:hypothetical protein E1K64_20340 [Salmonella enterica subsp. enterica serovar Poona]|nr:hypothetical protein [Salmonella enterica subsp. enterica serovar Poona]HEB6949303.1 hypothetical protein [Salmonella enterica subsp. enterica serovar Hvittingfoss]